MEFSQEPNNKAVFRSVSDFRKRFSFIIENDFVVCYTLIKEGISLFFLGARNGKIVLKKGNSPIKNLGGNQRSYEENSIVNRNSRIRVWTLRL